MSIAEQESEKIYPDVKFETLNGSSMNIDRSAQRIAYVQGRTSEPTTQQIEAVAELLWSEPWRKHQKSISWEAFKNTNPDEVPIRLYRARMILETALKAVK